MACLVKFDTLIIRRTTHGIPRHWESAPLVKWTGGSEEPYATGCIRLTMTWQKDMILAIIANVLFSAAVLLDPEPQAGNMKCSSIKTKNSPKGGGVFR